jgi:hypothetical protein
MKVRLQLLRDGARIIDDVHEIADAESFGRAFSKAWAKLRQAQFEGETSVGALMDHLDGSLLVHRRIHSLHQAASPRANECVKDALPTFWS